MTSVEISLIARWVVALWALGWLVLPLSARLFPFLPDQGLAVGRVLAIALGSLFCFWGAAVHLLPLSLSPLLLIAAPLAIAIGWSSTTFRERLAGHRRAFVLSDAIFLLAFGFFLWVRLRHSGASDLEKPMDMALISAAMRTNWLPFENPWFAGQPFTNYYYFGPLMGALIARTLATPPQFAYNLVEPLFCATFLSSTWALCSALSRSAKIGLVAMLLVCVGGHFEPLRQISQTHQFWPLDWWTTSRVIANTINEYPAFTLLIGDLHAHFYAFSPAIAFFGLCYGIVQSESVGLRSRLLLLGGVFLGIFAITNTWDTPFYGLLWLSCAWLGRQSGNWEPSNSRALIGALFAVPIVALPYFARFKSQVSGVVFHPWIPDPFSFVLLWGGWLVLGLLVLVLKPDEEKPSPPALFRRLLMGFGLLALLFPFGFYIRGVFGDGDLRHQDTVFKFGLQAWLLLGVGIACEAGGRLKSWLAKAPPLAWSGAIMGSATFAAVISLAPLSVLWARAIRDAPRNELGAVQLSLSAASYLPPSDREGIEWLRLNARPDEKVIEAVKFENGSFTGDYDPAFARVSAFSGVTSIVGWPQHVAGWGADWAEVNRRGVLIQGIFSDPSALEELRKLGATYLFSGVYEPKLPPSPKLEVVWKSAEGETQIMRLLP